MNSDDPHFKPRDAAFEMRLPISSGDAIRTIVAADGRLFALSDNCTIEIQTADALDPDRKNSAIPHINRVIAEFGVKDKLIVNTIMQYNYLMGHRDPPIASEYLQQIVISMLELLISINSNKLYIQNRYDTLRIEAEKWQKNARGPAVSTPLPQDSTIYPALEKIIKDCWKLIESIETYIRKVIPSETLNKQPKRTSFFRFFCGIDRDKITPFDAIVPIIEHSDGFFSISREIRNAIEHTKDTMWARYTDCVLGPNGLSLPSVNCKTETGTEFTNTPTDLAEHFTNNCIVLAGEVIAAISFAEYGERMKYGMELFPYEFDKEQKLYRFTIQIGDQTVPLG